MHVYSSFLSVTSHDKKKNIIFIRFMLIYVYAYYCYAYYGTARTTRGEAVTVCSYRSLPRGGPYSGTTIARRRHATTIV